MWPYPSQSFKDDHKDAAAGEQEALAMLTEGVTALGWLDWVCEVVGKKQPPISR